MGHASVALPQLKRSAGNTGALLRGVGWLLASAGIAALLLTVAFQTHPTYTINIGDAPHDTALIGDFNAPEQQSPADGGRRFRWTRGTSEIAMPGIGRGGATADFILSSSNNPMSDTLILANGSAIATLHLTPDFQPYHATIPTAVMAHGSLTLTLATAPFTPRGDRRTLGIVVERVTVQTTDRGFAVPPARIALSLWLTALLTALALLLAGFAPPLAGAASAFVALACAAFLLTNRLFLTVNAGGLLGASLLLLATVAAIRLLLPPLCRRLGLAITTREVRWLALIAGITLALRLAGLLHPGISIGDLKFHLHRFADVADNHTLLLPIESKEFGGRTVLYAPTPYLVMLPFSLLIHNRTLLLFLFSLALDALRFCALWFLARRLTADLLTANLVVLTMALMPVGWVVYSWGVFANIFAEGMLTLLFVLLILDYERLVGARRWVWCGVFAGVIALTLLAHIGVFVLTALTVMLSLVGRVVMNIGRHERAWGGGVMPFAAAGVIAAGVAFGLFYRFPAHDLLTGTQSPPIEQSDSKALPLTHQYRTGGATPDDRNGLPAITTSHLSIALALETWEMSYAFYRVWPVLACIAGIVILARSPRPSSTVGKGEQVGAYSRAPALQSAVLTLIIWMLVAAIMLVVGITAHLYVRYALYALPAVALGVGVALAWVIRRFRWGWCLAALPLAFSLITTLMFWYDRIVYDGKVFR